VKCKTSGIDPKFCTCIICQPPTRTMLMNCMKCPQHGVLDFVAVNSDAYKCRVCGELTSGLEMIQRKP
jgi:formate dehydrogenase maturation protein FdhE